MAFRVLVVGSRSWLDYPCLRDILDRALVNRLPDVEIVTPGGPGIPALAASYATSRGLPFLTVTLDFEKHPGDAVDRRTSRLVELADAAVLVLDGRVDGWRLERRLRAKGVPVVAIRLERIRRQEVERRESPRLSGGLPD